MLLQASPLEEECEAEGQIVCHQGRIKGQPGVAMDDLIYVSTKVPPRPSLDHASRPQPGNLGHALAPGRARQQVRRNFIQPLLLCAEGDEQHFPCRTAHPTLVQKPPPLAPPSSACLRPVR